MEEKGYFSIDRSRRKGEEGAAMVMVLLVAFLLLVASAGLILEAALNSANVTDATSEQQAYHAAESGLQRTLNVLRGNTVPSVLLDSTESAEHINNQIDFSKAVNLATSNLPTDASAAPRLSRWIAYDSTLTDRVALGPDVNEFAYSIEIIDPDNTGALLSYRTQALIDGSSGLGGYTFGSGGDTARIRYENATITDLDVSNGAVVSSNFGRFVVEANGAGATLTDDIRFGIAYVMTDPYSTVRMLRGTIKAGTVTPSSVGTVQIVFDANQYELMGSDVIIAPQTLSLNPPNVNGGVTIVTGTVTAAEPVRLIVKSTGYGPRGSRKELEAVVRKSLFDGMRAPATLTLVGGSTGFVFNPGSSNVTEYSGEDVAVENSTIPPIGTTNQSNLDTVQDSVDGLPPHPFNGDVVGTPADVSSEMPIWLSSAENLDATVGNLRDLATFAGRYFPSGTTPDNFGDNLSATGITFCDGDVSFTGSGGGILVVTGTLTLQGNFNFNGLILVTGAGGVVRQGAGTGTLQGNIVVAPYDPGNLASGFLPPSYDLSGGGNSTIIYNSSSLANGIVAVSNFVLGVAEK